MLLFAAAMWNARRILKEIADPELRKRVLLSFWKHAEPSAKMLAAAYLAKALHFREETLRKMPAEKKAELLGSRAGVPEFDQFLETALLQYHTHQANEMMGAFLDRWSVPHNHGSIESDNYPTPTAEQVRSAVDELSATYERRDIAMYLATAGLLMSDDCRNAMWPIADEMAGALTAA